jgi:multicomponent Na+:H+ antiporter subunit G
VIANIVSTTLWLFGAVFFFAGTVGLLRFPDVYSRLHALTKADNLGLGFVIAGLAVQAGDLAVVLKLVMIWALVLVSSSVSCQLIARSTWNRGTPPWRHP